MSSFYVDWAATFTPIAGLNAQAIAAGAAATGTDIIDSDLKIATEVTVEIAYGATAAGVSIFILHDIDGTNFESLATDQPFPLSLPGVASSTVRRSFSVPAETASRFKVAVSNPAGNSSVTVTVRYKQAIGTTVP